MPKETLRRAHHFFDMAMSDALRNPRLLETLMRIYYRDWAERLDFAAATFEPRSYTMPELRGVEADVVCRIPCRSGPEGAYAIVYLLIEHQSKPDFWIVFRLICCMVAIWLEQYRELLKLESKERLRPIIPLIFHTGTRRWTAPLTLKSLIEGGEEFARFIPEFEPLFLGLRDATDEQLQAAGAFGMALRALKRIDAQSAEVLPLIEQTVKALETVVGPQLRDLALLITRLVSYRRPIQDYNDLRPWFERLRVQAPEVMDMFNSSWTVTRSDGSRIRLPGGRAAMFLAGEECFSRNDVMRSPLSPMAWCILFAVVGRAEAGGAGILYVSSDFNHEVLRYDADTGQYLDVFIAQAAGGLNQPHGIVERRTDVLVAGFGTDQVLRYDRETGQFLGVFAGAATGINNPVYLRHGPDGYLYLSSQASHEIYRLCPRGGVIDVFISAGAGGLVGPSGFAFGPDGRFYVAGRYSANVIAYDAQTGAFQEVIADSSDGLGAGDTFGLNFGDNGDLYFASNGRVFRYDLDTQAIIATIPISFPIGVESASPGYVLVASSNNLYRIDTASNALSGPALTGGTINLLNFFHRPGPTPPATYDADCTGGVELADHAYFFGCYNGPGNAPAPPPAIAADDCLLTFDADDDGDIDLADFAGFQRRFGG